MFYDSYRSHVEALLFASGDPLSETRIAEILEVEVETVNRLLALLDEEYQKENRGICLRRVAGGCQLVTKSEHDGLIRRLSELHEIRLSTAALETLAIIAYRQPVTRAEMEAIRGVKVDGVVNNLTETGLICEVGRKESLGRPLLYGTTDLFLTTFAFSSLSDLPPLPEEALAVLTENTQIRNDEDTSPESDGADKCSELP